MPLHKAWLCCRYQTITSQCIAVGRDSPAPDARKPSAALMTCRCEASPVACSLKTLPPLFSEISSHWLFCFPHCDSCRNLFSSVLSGLSTVPAGRQQAAFFETERNICYAGVFPVVFLQACQGPLHKCTRCRNCQSSPEFFFHLK